MAKKRITELATETTLKDGQYVAIDHTTDGTKKLNLGAELTNLKEDFEALETQLDETTALALAALPQETIEDVTIASFDDGGDGVPVKELKVAIEPIQSGSGDPSPTNVRPISGRDSVTVTRTGVNGADSQTYTIPLSSTIYGGTLDVGTGVLTVDRALMDLGTLNWEYYQDGLFYTQNLQDVAQPSTDVICEIYKSEPVPISGGNDNIIYNNANGTKSIMRVRCRAYSDVTSFTNAIDGITAVYTLLSPTTTQLTPTQVTTLLKDNNIFADSGNVKKLIYRADLGAYIEKLINA